MEFKAWRQVTKNFYFFFETHLTFIIVGTELKTMIAASTPAGAGKTTWTIPGNYPQGTKFKIKITAVDAGVTVSDTGDNWFSIRY